MKKLLVLKNKVSYYLCFTFCCLLFTIVSKAQATNDQGRNSITVLFTHFSSGNPINSSIYKSYDAPSRFDYNDIGVKLLEISPSFEQTVTNEELEKQIQAQQIPNKILRSILVNERLGYMTTEVLEDRGMYSAKDADVIIAKNSANGLDILKDGGASLLKNIYFLIVEPTALSETKDDKTTQATIYNFSGTTHLYKIDITSMLASNEFWDMFYFDKPSDKMMDKLMNYHFSIKQVSTASFSALGTNLGAAGKIGVGLQLFSNSITGVSTSVQSKDIVYKTEKEIYTDLLNKAMNSSFASFEKMLGGFTIKQSIYKANPLQAKIGKKESLRPDDLFEVKEKILNTKTGAVSIQHVGYIRAKKVVNNKYKAGGNSKASTFYKIASRKITKGMELEKIKDPKYTFGVSYNTGENSLFSGFYVNTEYITHWLAGMRVGLDAGIVEGIKTTQVLYSGNSLKGNFTASGGFTAALSLKQSFHFHRITLTPLVGIYYSNLSISSSTLISSATMSKDFPGLSSTEWGGLLGADVGFNLGKTLQIHGGYRYGARLINSTKSGSNELIYDLKFGNTAASFGIRLFAF